MSKLTNKEEQDDVDDQDERKREKERKQLFQAALYNGHLSIRLSLFTYHTQL